ncbi:hypothetical protein GCM10028778_01970 [Barrientosiimonas marina]|uniref:YhcN/YlaJ family sporulation lipoprotein n=1 Tax=Lentibacillus kimchii TaxID=1542911 RepID=A0ABW2UPG4_9BACI
MKAVKLLGTIGLICSLCLLIGCTSNQDTSKNDRDVHFNTISTSDLDQSVSNQAKNSLSKLKGLTDINAINTNKQLIVAFETKQRKRLRLTKIQQDVQKKLENEFPKWEVEVSTDKKLVLETEKLEGKLSDNAISRKQLQQKTNHLIKLMNEKT